VNPLYPPGCRNEGVQGIVLLRVTISKEGVPVEVEPVNTMVDSRLVEAAKTAVWQWRYMPTLLNGNPVPVITQVDVNFTLAP
jgi:protein TonB